MQHATQNTVGIVKMITQILVGLAQLVEHLTEEWEVVGLIPRARPAVLWVLK